MSLPAPDTDAPRWLDPTAPGLAGWRLTKDEDIADTLRRQEWSVWTARYAKDPALDPTTPPAWAAVAPLLPDGVLPLRGSDWNIITPHRAVDGDTHRLWRTQVTWELAHERKAVYGTITAEWRVQVVYDDPAALPDGVDCRLLNLDTPEKGEVGYKLATAEAWAWIVSHIDRLRCIGYDQGGGFDRVLVDLYVLGGDGRIEETLSGWMLRYGNNGKGWAPYVPAALRKASRYGS